MTATAQKYFRHLIIPALLLLAASLLTTEASAGFAALDPIRMNGIRPMDVAVSQDNTLYAVAPGSDLILAYDSNHNFLWSMAVSQPRAIAVDHDTLYVSSNADLSVAIIDGNGYLIGYLGQGAGEFKSPVNIAIDPFSLEVYVVDQLDHSIKIYSPDGVFLRKIDDFPNLPLDVTVAGGEVFVLDQPLVMDLEGNRMRDARVAIFDTFGAPLGSFGARGSEEGLFERPKSLTSDGRSRIYVADSVLGTVLSFDRNGTYLRSIQPPDTSGGGSLGMALDQGGMLLVSVPGGRRINRFLINGSEAGYDTGWHSQKPQDCM